MIFPGFGGSLQVFSGWSFGDQKCGLLSFLGGLGKNLKNVGIAVAGSIIAYCFDAIITYRAPVRAIKVVSSLVPQLS